jgi:hypothetical protein
VTGRDGWVALGAEAVALRGVAVAGSDVVVGVPGCVAEHPAVDSAAAAIPAVTARAIRGLRFITGPLAWEKYLGK